MLQNKIRQIRFISVLSLVTRLRRGKLVNFEGMYAHVFCHFLLAQKVTKKGTTKTNHLLDLVAQTCLSASRAYVSHFS
jgi:hypothetical protein